MRVRPPSLDELMNTSAGFLQDTARGVPCLDQEVAQRLLLMPDSFRQWETEHGRMMKAVVDAKNDVRRAGVLRNACFGFIHQTAFFEYLRENKVSGRDRRALFALVRGDRDYVGAVLAEHAIYLRSTVSLLCARHLGRELLEDRVFGGPLDQYQTQYAEYFGAFCRSETDAQAGDSIRTLVPYLKRRLVALRRDILAMSLQVVQPSRLSR